VDSGGADAAHIVLAPIAGKGEGSRELNDWLNSIEKVRDAAERKRLFYVACTRAREELHLFASPEAKSDGSISPAYGSLLSAAWPAAERHFADSHESSDNVRQVSVSSKQEALPFTTDDFIGDLAAAIAKERPVMLERLPLNSLPATRFTSIRRLEHEGLVPQTTIAQFERPEGSFEARVLGNAIHSFLETIAKRLAQGLRAEQMLREVSAWEPRISAVLRSDGLAAPRVRQLTSRVRTALENT
jgi:ATP-dependent exoDNAse (exonuclease V) beta subunit